MTLNRHFVTGKSFDDISPNDEAVKPGFDRGGVEVTPKSGGFRSPDLSKKQNENETEKKKPGLFSNPFILLIGAIIVVVLVLRS